MTNIYGPQPSGTEIAAAFKAWAKAGAKMGAEVNRILGGMVDALKAIGEALRPKPPIDPAVWPKLHSFTPDFDLACHCGFGPAEHERNRG